MPRKSTSKRANDRGRNYYETSSPFETFEPGGPKPKTFSGLVDETPNPSTLDSHFLSGNALMGRMQPEQYDNPRGYPGLAMVTTGDQKGKSPVDVPKHSITHHMEGSAALSRTGKRT